QSDERDDARHQPTHRAYRRPPKAHRILVATNQRASPRRQALAGTRATAATAERITSATASGCEIITTCDESTSVIVAPARSAIDRVTSVPAALSAVPTTAHDGSFFQAAGPFGSENASSAMGRWLAAISAVASAGRSAAKASRNPEGSMLNSTACSPLLVG